MKTKLQTIIALLITVYCISCNSIRYSETTSKQVSERKILTEPIFFGYNLDSLISVLNEHISLNKANFNISNKTLNGEWIRRQPNYILKGNWEFTFLANRIDCRISIDPELQYIVFIEKIDGRLVVVEYEIELE